MTKTFAKFYQIDWKHCASAVYHTQCAIVKAWQAKDLPRVRALQAKLVRSYEARALAVKKVRTNPGGKTPGVDGVVWDGDAALMGAIVSLRHLSRYEPMPVKRVYIPKAHGGRRPLGIPTMHDRAVQTLFAFALGPIAECTADARSYGYRPYKSAHDAAAYLRLVLGAKYAKRWVLEADIEKFFDTLSHEWLLKNIPMDRKVLAKFLKAGFMDAPQRVVYETPKGTPQGGVISPIIANMALDGLEEALGKRFRVVRYADDFVVAGKTRSALQREALPAVQRLLAERGLTLARRKTRITSVEEGFDFLGFTFREYKNTLRAIGYKKGIFLITPAKAKVLLLKKRLKRIVKALRHRPPLVVIMTLNPILRGWAQYYKSVNATKTFASLRHYLWELMWMWCRTRHPTMPLGRLRRKYFTRLGGNRWVFHARNAANQTVTLVQIGWTKLARHTLCANLNPYLPENRGYYLARQGASSRTLLTAHQTKLRQRQQGVCPVCATELHNGEPLDVHHILPRTQGGKDTLGNLLLLHQFCHKQVTYAKDARLKAAWKKAGIVADGP